MASTLVPENLSTAADAAITVARPTSTSTSYIWTLDPVQDTINNCVIFYDKENKVLTTNPVRYIAPEETKTCAGLKLYASFVSRYTNEQKLKWEVVNEGAAVINGDTGSITGNTPGSDTPVRVSSANHSGESGQYTMHITAVPNGTYYLRNKETELHADIGSQTVANGATVQQWEFDGADTQKWKVTHRGDGTYTIRTAATTNSVYMGVSENSTASGAGIVLRTGTIEDGMIWNIQIIANGAYKLIPESGKSANLVLSAQRYDGVWYDSDVALQQKAYTNDIDCGDEWILHRHLDYTLMFLGAVANDPNMPELIEFAQNSFAEHTQFLGYGKTSITKCEMSEHLTSSKLIFYITHGYLEGLRVSDGLYTVYDLDNIPQESFNDLRFVYLGACSTGRESTAGKNLVDTLHDDKGVDAVLGFTYDVSYNEVCVWTRAFVASIAEGNSVKAAMDAADDALENEYHSPPSTIKDEEGNDVDATYTVSEAYRYYVGDINIVPCA